MNNEKDRGKAIDWRMIKIQTKMREMEKVRGWTEEKRKNESIVLVLWASELHIKH